MELGLANSNLKYYSYWKLQFYSACDESDSLANEEWHCEIWWKWCTEKTGWEFQCYKREIPKNKNIRKLWEKYKINLRQIRNSQEI